MKIESFFGSDKLPDGFKLIPVGNVSFPTGKIVAGDPFFLPESELMVEIHPNHYPVNIIYRDCAEWGYRVTLAFLRISKNEVVKWKAVNNKDGMDTFSVDSGIGCITDLHTAKNFNALLNKWREQDPPLNYYDIVLKNELSKKVLPGERVNFFGIHSLVKKGGNIAIFETGMGDGSYKMKMGFDAHQDPAIFLIDFDLLKPLDKL
jgi:hypothetical protein